MKRRKSVEIIVALSAMGAAIGGVASQAATPSPAPFVISPVLPSDILPNAPASSATPTQAALFAWQEFIALNWPAVPQTGLPGTRDHADTNKMFGDPSYTGPLVWHTYRSKIEIFPGQNAPPGGTQVAARSACLPNTSVMVLAPLPLAAPMQPPYYGYDALPQYIYQSGAIPGADSNTPWINLDESSQIGLDNIYAGVASANNGAPGTLGNQILFLAKANRVEFDYIAPKGWWTLTASQPCATQTASYIKANQSDPPAGSPTLVSFPNGTVELKAAWRKLAPSEDASRFYTTVTRHYVSNSTVAGGISYVDETLALIALHIIQKTPTAPYFVFATFEQADNITLPNTVNAQGQPVAGGPVEDVNGNVIATPAPAAPLTPNVSSNNSTPTSNQTFTPLVSTVTDPNGQLYYVNVPLQNLVEGKILVNKRKHPITPEIIAVNTQVHAAIAQYVSKNFGSSATAPWAYYKLINVQTKPIAGKPFGKTYTGKDISTYYQANSVVETDYNLQVFSGRFSGRGYGNTISDYKNGQPFNNVTYKAPGHKTGVSYNMGGCMGCHGNMQQAGFDFSFILGGGRVAAPDVVGPTLGSDFVGIQKYLSKR